MAEHVTEIVRIKNIKETLLFKMSYKKRKQFKCTDTSHLREVARIHSSQVKWIFFFLPLSQPYTV